MSFPIPTKTEENKYEKAFRWYCEELLEKGFLESFDREAESFLVFKPVYHKREKHYKSKENSTEQITLLRELSYTYDFRLFWTEKAKFIFTEVYDPEGFFRFGNPNFISHWIDYNGDLKLTSYVDVKPNYQAAQFGGGKMASYYTFPLVQKILMNLNGLFINKIIPINSGKKYGVNTNLFATTFTPNRYKFTDGGGQLREIPFRTTPIDRYVSNRQKIIDDLLADIENKNGGPEQQSLF